MQQSKNENLSYRTARLPYWVIGVTTAIFMLGMVGYSFFQGNRLVTTYAPLVDAAMEIKLEATMAHLWFAEILSNDRFVEIEDVWFHLEQADWYAQAMLEGGENAEGRFVPLDDPVMRQQIEAVRTQLTVFRDIAQQRYELGVLVTTDADIDEQYDAEFEDFIEKADQVETELQQLMAQDLNRFRVIQTGLIIGGLLFFVGLGFSYNQLDKRRLQDLSLRNKVQRALRESEEKHRLLANNTLDVIWLMNLELKFTYVNQSVRTLLDFAPEEWIGSTLPDHCPPEEMAKMAGLIAREMADLPNQMGVVFESEFYHKDGTAVPVEIQSTILLDENGQPVGLQGTTRDIRERKKAEAERETLLAQVQEQAKQMNEIMRTVPQGVILLDAVGQIISANKIAAQDLKLLANAAVGEKITQMGNRALSELLTSPPTKGLWHEVQAGNRIFEIISRPVANGPEPEKWVLVSNDVTREREVREKMEQQERLAAVGQLAAGIAHDFNNILAVITLYSELSTFAEGLPDDVQKRLGTITQQAHHASRLVQQILDFSRRAVLELRSLDLAILLKEQVKLLQRTLPENIKIDLNCSPDDYLINADPTRMQQMIMNLAVNARDALPEGGHLHLELKKIRFETKNQSPLVEIEPGEWIVLSVHDDGIGMPPDVLAHIFEPFFTTKPTGTGNGLGLAQVHGIVGQHGGHIAVESTVNEGTIFRIYLPSLPLVVEEMRLLNLDDIPLGRGELVLVVEDNAVWRMTLVESLQTLAYEVIEASDGQEALAKMAEYGERVALILSDVVMPQMGGVALFHALQKADWQTPIIFMSGHPMENDLEELEGPGLKRFLVKPVNYEDLAQSVAEAIRG